MPEDNFKCVPWKFFIQNIFLWKLIQMEMSWRMPGNNPQWERTCPPTMCTNYYYTTEKNFPRFKIWNIFLLEERKIIYFGIYSSGYN